MKLIRFIVEPGVVLSQVGSTSWIAPFLASMVLFAFSGVLMISAAGTRTLFDSARTADPGAFGEETTLTAFQGQMLPTLAFGAVFTMIRVVAIAATIWAILRYFAMPVDYFIALAICAYASYLRELVSVILRLLVVVYHYSVHIPLAGPVVLRTNLTFLSDKIPTGGAVGSLASSIDILSLGFAFMVAFGLSRRIADLGLERAVRLVALPWITWIVLKAILDIRSKGQPEVTP